MNSLDQDADLHVGQNAARASGRGNEDTCTQGDLTTDLFDEEMYEGDLIPTQNYMASRKLYKNMYLIHPR